MRTAWRIQEIAWLCCAGVSDDLRRIWISADFAVGNRYENLALGSFGPRVGSNTT